MAGLSKSRIIQHLQCPKRLWLSINRPELAEVDGGVTARMAAGNEVGAVARGLYPAGFLIETSDARQALADTAKALSGKQRPLFEAAFSTDGVFFRADLLLPVEDGYRLVEVKSSTSVKDYHLADAAIQAWVAVQNGLTLKSIEIAHINNQFAYTGDCNYDGLFTYADISQLALPLSKKVPEWVQAAKATLVGKEPENVPGAQCHAPFACPFLVYCAPKEEGGYPPEILPYRDGKTLAAQLRAEGFDDLRTVPGERFSSPKHQRIWQVTKSGRTELDTEAGAAIEALTYPRYYLDFETIDFAVPIWAGTRPYRQLPFQWSCHVERENGTIEHQEFLAADASDPRRAFAEALISTLKTTGPVLVYNAGFESGRLRELAGDFPDLAPAIETIRIRIFDLLPLARKHYYHREMRGSWSLKAVLPTIAPELAYDSLEVANGGMAQDAYREIIHPDTPPDRALKLRQDLLVYCERDTWAMVRLAQFFQNR